MSADDTTCDDLPPWARTRHPAPVREHVGARARATVDAAITAKLGTAAVPVRFSVVGTHAAVACDLAATEWHAWVADDNGRCVATRHPTLSDASAWAWQQVRP